MICQTCRQEIRPGEQLTIIHWLEGDQRVHRNCIAAAAARAESAEAHADALAAEVERLRARWQNIEAMADADVDFDAPGMALIQKLGMAYHRGYREGEDTERTNNETAIAALRAQLASAGWLPVSLPPPDEGLYLISEYGARSLAIWHQGKWLNDKPLGKFAYPQYYQPLPPPPPTIPQ